MIEGINESVFNYAALLQLLFLYLTRIYHLTLFDILHNVPTEALALIVNNPVPLDIMGVCDLSVSVKQRSVIT